MNEKNIKCKWTLIILLLEKKKLKKRREKKSTKLSAKKVEGAEEGAEKEWRKKIRVEGKMLERNLEKKNCLRQRGIIVVSPANSRTFLIVYAFKNERNRTKIRGVGIDEGMQK